MSTTTRPAPTGAHRRWWLWLPLLGLSALLAWQPPPPEADADIVQPVAGGARPKQDKKPTTDVVALLPIQDRSAWAAPAAEQATQGPIDLFGQHNWTPPPKPQPTVKPLPPPPPTAPPLPFTLLGKQWNGAAWEVYLARGDHSHIVREGSQFAQSYRVDRIAPPHMTLTYLPLEQTQTLYIGEAP
ncbi:hypothetical protein KIH07_06095 [Hydrogenophaga taeniospiralis]|uniref:hypothetical protein n=1 Tax=Hydrogenophaga taeniospiralis TaxID=65656 RepID=UPI001CFA0EAE|nr:hypothetical protein [Hydrogenophaga taeniospiralis]MCB4363298.1 hypothetical protein [Hydrogenophaga taeniospiralis]